jgi:uncharacterized protein (TIGR00369 family)
MLPAYAQTFGMTLGEDETGAPLILLPFAEELLGRPGFLHGGAIAGLLEVAARAALDHALARAGIAATVAPLTITVDYRRGGRDRRSHAAGTVTRLGTRIANIAATAWQDDRASPIATAQATYRLIRS